MTPLRFAVLASGGGSNLQAILDRISVGDLTAKCLFVASNNGKSLALERARRSGIEACHISSITEGSEEAAVAKLLKTIDYHPLDLLVLAGYMKKVPDAVLHRLKNRVINIHPALLPSFGGRGYYGEKVHEAVIREGCRFTGITIHMVNEEYDAGQIVLQRKVPVPHGCDAQAMGQLVLAMEHDSYWRVLKGFADGEIVSTDRDGAGEAVRINPEWLKRMHALEGLSSL